MFIRKLRAESLSERFIAYLQQHKHLLQTLPLNTLTDTRLGIDAAFYLSQVLDPPPEQGSSAGAKEPLLAATGGVPLSLAARVENDLRVLEKLRIKPVFVFPGLLPKKTLRTQGPINGHNPASTGIGSANSGEYAEEIRERREAWELYERGQIEQAEALFEGRSGVTHWELWRSVLRMFRNRNVEFLVAPYTATAQVSVWSLHTCVLVTEIFFSGSNSWST